MVPHRRQHESVIRSKAVKRPGFRLATHPRRMCLHANNTLRALKRNLRASVMARAVGSFVSLRPCTLTDPLAPCCLARTANALPFCRHQLRGSLPRRAVTPCFGWFCSSRIVASGKVRGRRMLGASCVIPRSGLSISTQTLLNILEIPQRQRTAVAIGTLQSLWRSSVGARCGCATSLVAGTLKTFADTFVTPAPFTECQHRFDFRPKAPI